MTRPVDDPSDPGYRPPLRGDESFPPEGAVDHPNLKELLYSNLGPGQVVVDVGCGPGPFEYHRYRAQFIAFDAFPPETGDGLVEGRDEFRQAHLEQFPIGDASCDAVVMGFILEHVSDPLAFLREAHRVLRPGGWCYVSVPNYRSLEDRLFRLATRVAGSTRGPHIQRFTFANFQQLAVGDAGFELVAWHLLPASYLWMEHPKLRFARRPFIRMLRVLRATGFDGFREGNYQFLYQKVG